MGFPLQIAGGQPELRIWLKWAFLVISVGSLISGGVLLWIAEPDHQETTQKLPQEAVTEIDKPLLVEREGDRLVWRLQAKSARQQTGGNLDMDIPQLDLFTKAGLQVPVQSQNAFFDSSSRSIRFEGDVVVVYGEWELRSQKLIYGINHDVIRVPDSFRLNGPGVIVKGKNMIVYRQEQRLLVKEKVWIRDSRPGSWEFGQ
ncbi:MAG: LPS export ABC transporter periplasmic protein LptC [Mariprofundaceae bacterium]